MLVCKQIFLLPLLGKILAEPMISSSTREYFIFGAYTQSPADHYGLRFDDCSKLETTFPNSAQQIFVSILCLHKHILRKSSFARSLIYCLNEDSRWRPRLVLASKARRNQIADHCSSLCGVRNVSVVASSWDRQTAASLENQWMLFSA
jgi:hypothetical protein